MVFFISIVYYYTCLAINFCNNLTDTAEVVELERTIKYTVVQNGKFADVCVECSFSDDSQDSCVVIIHEVLSCPDLTFPCDTFIMNIEASRKLNRSGERAYGCIQTVNLTFYEVGVIGGELVSTLDTPGTYKFLASLKLMKYYHRSGNFCH